MAELKIQIEDEVCTDEVFDFAKEAQQCIELYAKKNHDYGNSFDMGMEHIGASYGLGRIYDKVNRLITLSKFDDIKKTAVVNESTEDTLRDLVCYAIMMITFRKRQINKEQQKINFE